MEQQNSQSSQPEIKWSWTKFAIGKLSNKLIAWIVYMVLQFNILSNCIVPDDQKKWVIIASAIVTVIFMLAGAIDNAVSNMKINAELKAGISK